jgi:hypothetical protein
LKILLGITKSSWKPNPYLSSDRLLSGEALCTYSGPGFCEFIGSQWMRHKSHSSFIASWYSWSLWHCSGHCIH